MNKMEDKYRILREEFCAMALENIQRSKSAEWDTEFDINSFHVCFLYILVMWLILYFIL